MTFRVPTQQYSFTSGVLDDTLEARSDIRAYYSGAREILNMMGLPQGGVDMRAGLKKGEELAAASTGCRLAKFEFSTEQAYLIAFTDLEIRVYKDGVLQATVVSPYADTDLADLDWTQSLDTMILVHPDYEPRKLVRTGSHTSWALSTLSLRNVPTYNFGDPTTGDATPSGTTGSINITSTASDFSGASVGDTVRINNGRVEITTVTSATQVAGTVKEDLDNTTVAEAGDWTLEEDAWSAARGYPRTVFLREGRLYFGGSKSLPQTEWGSESNDFWSFKTTKDAFADEAVEASLDGDRVSAIEQQYALDDMFLFTSGGLFVHTESPTTPDNFYFQRHSEMPAAKVRPVELDGSVAYIRRGDDGEHQSLQELVYDDVKQIYTTQDLALLAGSLMRGPVDMAARLGNESDSANHIFVVNGDDGTVAVLNTRKSQQITGWTLLQTNGIVQRIAVVSNVVWFLVKRTLNSVDKYYLESLDSTLQLDSSVYQTAGSPTSAWSGLSHLNGETVSLIGDGAYMGTATVSAGAVTTPYDVSTLEVGLPFDWAVETMPIEAQLADGTLIGNRHRITRATIRVKNTVALTVNGRTVSFKKFGDGVLDAPPTAYTGLKTVRFLGWTGGRDGQGATIRMTGDSTGPATILSVTAEVAQ